MGFPRQEYWSWLPFPSPGYLPDPGIEPRSPALRADSLPAEPQGKDNKGSFVIIMMMILFISSLLFTKYSHGHSCICPPNCNMKHEVMLLFSC